MSTAIGVTKEIENDLNWKIYKNYISEPVSLSHHIIDLELVNCKGKQNIDFLRSIDKYVDYSFSYRYIIENHKVDHLAGKIVGRCTLSVKDCKQRIATAFCTPFTEIYDSYDVYVHVTKAPHLIFSRVSENKLNNMCFSLPFLKGVLLGTPDIEPNSNISFITVTNSLQENYIYLLLGNQLYSFSRATILK